MFKRVGWYVLREVLPLYGVGLVVFLLLTTTDLISVIAGALLRYDATLTEGVRIYLSRLPALLGWVLPLAVPFAVLIGLGRLARDSELKALAASGVRPTSVLWPLVPLGLLVSAIAFYNANVLTPAGNARWFAEWARVQNAGPPEPLGQDLYTHRQGDTLFYSGRVQPLRGNPTQAQLWGVLVHTPEVLYTAQNGTWDAKRQEWVITRYWETRPDRPPVQRDGERRFKQTDRLRPPSAPPDQLTLPALRQRAQDAALDVRERREAQFELQRRFAEPFGALGFALAAGATGLLVRNRAWSFAAMVLMIFGVYVVWSAAPQLAKLGALPAAFAAWLPNLLLFGFTAVLVWRLR